MPVAIPDRRVDGNRLYGGLELSRLLSRECGLIRNNSCDCTCENDGTGSHGATRKTGSWKLRNWNGTGNWKLAAYFKSTTAYVPIFGSENSIAPSATT